MCHPRAITGVHEIVEVHDPFGSMMGVAPPAQESWRETGVGPTLSGAPQSAMSMWSV